MADGTDSKATGGATIAPHSHNDPCWNSAQTPFQFKQSLLTGLGVLRVQQVNQAEKEKGGLFYSSVGLSVAPLPQTPNNVPDHLARMSPSLLVLEGIT